MGYARGNDKDGTLRKHALIVLDWIYRLNPPHTQGVKSYFGLGLNYDVYTTGKVGGSLGGQGFYGVEGEAGEGNLYAEVGYGAIRTGFSPAYVGLMAVLGYRI